jgi:tetratricopeptide (TPR) repeat protein
LNWLNQLLEDEKRVPILVQLAQIHSELERFDKAQELIDEAKELSGEGPHHGLEMSRSQILAAQGEFTEAESILRELLEIYPGDARILTQLGQVLMWVGQLDEAAACFEQASKINPTALASMVNAKKIPDNPEAIRKMKTLADNPLLAKPTRISMSFALAEVFDKKSDFEQGFAYLDEANRLTNQGLDYNPDNFSQRVENIIQIFDEDFFASLNSIRISDRTPIFVVGMPRSGTTLTEQILASHRQVFGAGELSLLPKLTQLMPRVLKTKEQYPQCMRLMTPHLREEAARYYLTGILAYDSEHPYVVDKMPHNFTNLGLIASILPKAKIIHIQRDPRDTALSNFQQNFKARHGGMGFAFNLENIAYQINDYHRIMEHWRKVLPTPMLEIRYEDLVADQEGETRRMLDYLGLDWDEGMREFYKTERAVRTASVAQVRQPVYQTSKKKWKKYEKHLGPLLENLNLETYAEWEK